MAEITTIARPYAKAAFKFALEHDALDQWSQTLGFLAAVTSDAQMKMVLQSPTLSSEEKAQTLLSLQAGELGEQSKNFVCQLAENSRLSLLPEIFHLFELLKAEQEKTVDIEVSTAYELAPEQEQQLAQSLKNRLGREVFIHSDVDKSLIGGLVIRAGDLVIDSSVKGKLEKLSASLNS